MGLLDALAGGMVSSEGEGPSGDDMTRLALALLVAALQRQSNPPERVVDTPEIRVVNRFAPNP